MGQGNISYTVLPSQMTAFFKKAVLKDFFSQSLLQFGVLFAQLLNLAGARLAHSVAFKAFLASFQKLTAPAVVQVLMDAFLAAELSDTLLTSNAGQNNADLFLAIEFTPRLALHI